MVVLLMETFDDKEGKGKVKCIRFLNTKYSGGGMASTLDYNAND